MPLFTTTSVGALLGLKIQLHSNALRRLPLMRHPWEHVLAMGLGVVFAHQFVKWGEQMEVDRQKMVEKARAANERRYIDADDD